MSGRNRPVRLAPAAQRDFDNLLLYSLLTWGEARMERYRASLNRGLTAIGDNPEIGRSRDRLLPGLRSFQVEHHHIFYLVTPSLVEVARILHERADFGRHLGKRRP